MPSFDYTVELERALLKTMVSSQMLCRAHLHTIKEELFSSPQRKFILSTAQAIFAASRNTLTKMVFEYEVNAKIDVSDATHYVSEWNMIDALEVTEAPDVLIIKLQEANTGRKVLQLGSDLVIMLEQGQIEEAVAHLKQTSFQLGNKVDVRQLVNLTDFEARKQMILDKRAHPERYLGIKTGLPTLDLRTGGLFKGELTLIAGITGIGKSTLVKEIERGIITMNKHKNVLHIANEEYQEQVEHKFDAGLTGIPYLDFKLAKITDEDMARWEKMMKNWHYGNIFLKEVPAFTDVTLVEQAFYELQNKGINIDVIVIDHLPHIKSIQKAWDPNDELKKAASDCKEIAKSLHVACVVPTQAATIVAEKQAKSKRAGQLDVYGSKGQIHVANTFMIITEQGKDDTQIDREEWERDVYWMCDMKKNRDGGKFWFRAKHHVRIGKIEEVSEKDNSVIQKDEGAQAAMQAFEKDAAELAKKEVTELEKSEEEAMVEVEPPVSEVEELEDEAAEEAPAPIPVPANIPVKPPVAGGVPSSMMSRFKKK
jgi:replicative DNA helicase